MIIREKVRSYIRENFLYGRDAQLSDTASLLDAGIIDSTGAMELVSFLESEFGIRVDDRDLVPENLDSVCAMTEFVTRRRAEAQELGGASLAAAPTGTC